MSNFNFKKLHPFKWYVLQNFPFIEEDFDAITYYQLLCKVIEYLNKVIDSQNLTGEQVETLTNAFNTLKEYVDTYFDNLDVQDEINHKLDEMVTDGTFDTIINQTLFNQINDDIDTLKSNNTIFVGDSYGAVDNSWIDRLANMMGLTIGTNAYKIAQSGYGFARTNQQFITLLQNASASIPNKQKIKNIVVGGGLNDINADSTSDILTAINLFCQYCNTTYPNAHIYIACLGWHEHPSNSNIREQMINKVLQAYTQCGINKNTTFCNGVQYIMHYYAFYGVDASHPNDTAQSYFARGINTCMKGQEYLFSTTRQNVSLTSGGTLGLQIKDNKLIADLRGNINSASFPSDTAIGNKTIELTDNKLQLLRNCENYYSWWRCGLNIKYDDNTWEQAIGQVFIDGNGILKLTFLKNKSNAITGLGFWGSLPYTQNLLYF